jgi:hypothetical protein
VKLEKQIEIARVSKDKAEQAKRDEENQFNAVMGRFNDCVFPEFPGKATTPDEAISVGSGISLPCIGARKINA